MSRRALIDLSSQSTTFLLAVFLQRCSMVRGIIAECTNLTPIQAIH